MNFQLCFHGIGKCEVEREPGEQRYWVDRSMYLAILDEVHHRADVQISFDDGNASDLETGLPALQERGMTATFFALAGRLDDPASLSPDDLRTLSTAGMTIGTHGWDHVSWRGLTPSQADRELKDARDTLAQVVGSPIEEAALPLGQYDRALLRRLKEWGYKHVYTSDRLPSRPNSWIQPRYSVTSQDTVLSIREFLRGRRNVSMARNTAASMVKRLR